MVIRPFSELGIGVVWARSARVPSGNRYSTEAIFVLDKKHTNINGDSAWPNSPSIVRRGAISR